MTRAYASCPISNAGGQATHVHGRPTQRIDAGLVAALNPREPRYVVDRTAETHVGSGARVGARDRLRSQWQAFHTKRSARPIFCHARPPLIMRLLYQAASALSGIARNWNGTWKSPTWKTAYEELVLANRILFAQGVSTHSATSVRALRRSSRFLLTWAIGRHWQTAADVLSFDLDETRRTRPVANSTASALFTRRYTVRGPT